MSKAAFHCNFIVNNSAMIDSSFCELLEYTITAALQNSLDERIKGYWCDGVLLPLFEHEYSQEYVRLNKQILLTAFVGANGQDKYEIILLLGSDSLSKYAKGEDISDCIPDVETIGAFTIDNRKKQLKINLS